MKKLIYLSIIAAASLLTSCSSQHANSNRPSPAWDDDSLSPYTSVTTPTDYTTKIETPTLSEFTPTLAAAGFATPQLLASSEPFSLPVGLTIVALLILFYSHDYWVQKSKPGFKALRDLKFSETANPPMGDFTSSMLEGDFDMSGLVGTEIGDIGDEAGDVIELGDEIGEITGATYGEEGGPRKFIRNARLKHAKKVYNRSSRKIAKLGGNKGSIKGTADAEFAAMGGINAADLIKFINVSGFTIQSVDAFREAASFPAYLLKASLDRSQLESPGIMSIGTSSNVSVEFGTSTGVTPYYLYSFAVIKMGVAELNGVANQTITVTVKLPLLNGSRPTIVITGQVKKGYDATITVFPFTIVQGEPQYVYGKIGGNVDTSEEVLVTIGGLPSTAVASVLVPLSNHKLFRKMQAKVSK